MITQRALLFGFVGFCFYLIAIVNALPPFYYALTWLTAGILVSCFGIALLSLMGVECGWSVREVYVTESLLDSSPLDLSESDDVPPQAERETNDEIADGPGIDVHLFNGGTLNKTDVVIEVRLSSVRGGERFTHRFLLEALPSGGKVSTTLPLYDLPRGRYRVEELRLIGSDVLGLFRMRKRVLPKPVSAAEQSTLEPENAATDTSQSQSNASSVDRNDEPHEIVVGPALITMSAHAEMWRSGGMNGGTGEVSALGQGDEVRGTRPYVAGDDLRFVHWKSTARRGELVVREFHHTAQPQSFVIWDGRQIDEGKRGGAEEQNAVTEYSLRVAGSLCAMLRESGRPCGLLRLDKQPLWVPPSGRGTSSATRLIETLADAQPNREESFSAAFAPWLRQIAAGTQTFVVTPALDEVAAAVPMFLSQRLQTTVCFVDRARFGEASRLKSKLETVQGTLHVGSAGAAADFSAGDVGLREHGVVVVRAPRQVLGNAKRNRRHTDRSSEIQAIRSTLNELLHGPNAAGPAMNVAESNIPIVATASRH
jgi:uncharacterized protein (DUF58 family)